MHDAEEQHNFMRNKPHEGLIRDVIRELKAYNPLFRQLRELGTRADVNAAVRVEGYFSRRELVFVQMISFGDNRRKSLLIAKESNDNRYREASRSASWRPTR